MTRASGRVRQARRLMRALQILGHLMVGLFVADVILLLLLRFPSDRARRWRARLVQWWSRGVCRILCVRITVVGGINPPPALYVANHISWLDIPCLHALIGATFVAKDEVRRWPVIGRMAFRADTIFIKRGGPVAAASTAEQMTWALTRKQALILFPEGTTTDGRGVRHFHARLYQAAIRTRVPVQAIAIHYPHQAGAHPAVPFVNDDNLVRHLWALLAEECIEIRVTFCPARAAVAGIPRRALAELTRAQVQAALAGTHGQLVHQTAAGFQ